MYRFISLLLLGVLSHTASALELKGPLEQGGMVIGKVTPGTKVSLDGRSVEVTADGRFVIGFGRDAKASAKLTTEDASGKHVRKLVIKPRQYHIQSVHGIPKKIMSPSAADYKHIIRDVKEVKAARSKNYHRMDFAGPFLWPLQGTITGVYGSQRVYNGKPGRPHYGVDVAAAVGTPVTAPAPGIVTVANPDMFYSGGTVIIDHGYGISSTLMHLSKVLVKVGQEVKPGDIIGEVGSTGRATGPHLDWRMNWFNKARIDPQLLAPSMPAHADARDALQRIEKLQDK